MISSRFINSLLAFVCLIYFLPPPALAGGDDWKLIDPADLALKTPVVEKDADAEVIFWDVKLDDSTEDLIFSHYVRIKVFTDRGREAQSKIDIQYYGGYQIKDIAARTVKPDGSIVELKKADIFERTIVKLSGAKVKAKSFAMPSVEPGSIIEYRWREVRPGRSANYVRLPFQREIPVQRVTYHFKPSENIPGAMQIRYFHMPPVPLGKEKDGFHSLTMTNVPAFHEEPRMPPEDEVRPWLLVYYSATNKLIGEKFWQSLGKGAYEGLKPDTKVNDEVRQAATEAVGDATTPEEKLRRLYDYCRTKIKNVYDPTSGMTAEDRAKRKENKSPADTLKRGVGSGDEVNKLFVALATAAGFDARPALLSDRSDIFFNREFPDSYFLRAMDVAVKVGDQWRFFDPGSRYVPFGMLTWREEGIDALIADPKDPVFVKTQITPPDKSKQIRTAKLRLSEDGTLEGDIRVEYSGHSAIERKRDSEDESPAQREQTLRDLIKGRMSTAEISDIKIENAADPVKPFAYAYHVRVPGYAQRTGKRLFLQPAFFERGMGPLFSASDRKNAVYFHYPWSEQDHLTIELPAGFALDNADVPAPIPREMTQNICEQKTRMAVTTDGRSLIYDRNFFFGGGGGIVFPASSYSALKQLFDLINQADDHTITLKQAAATPN
jgi:transglutaminase-like putative cysteine protease